MELLNKTKRERKVNKGSYYKIKTDFGFSQEKFLYFINTYSYVVQYQINRHKKEEQKERTTMNLLWNKMLTTEFNLLYGIKGRTFQITCNLVTFVQITNIHFTI